MHSLVSILTLSDLELKANIGWSEEERGSLQTIYITIEIQFEKMPKSTDNDDLEDTICYDNLSQKIASFIENNHFKLLEKLGYALYEILALDIQPHKFNLIICKDPPLEYRSGRACFIIKGFK